jgi:hypothetical protein
MLVHLFACSTRWTDEEKAGIFNTQEGFARKVEMIKGKQHGQ